MGLRTPQQLQKTQVAKTPTVRDNGSGAVQVSEAPINTISQALDQEYKTNLSALEKARKEQDALVKDQIQNALDASVIEAKAITANAKGSNAIAQSQQQRDNIKKNASSIISKYPAEYQRKYGGLTDEAINKYNAFAIPHEYGEINKLKETTLDERMNNEMDDLVGSATDPAQFDEKMIGLIQTASRKAGMIYGSSPDVEVLPGISAREASESFVNQTVSKAYTRVIEQQSAANNWQIAQKFLDENGSKISEADKVKAMKLIDTAKNNNETDQAKTLMKLASEAHPDNSELQREFLYANSTSDKIYKESTQMMSTRDSIQQRQKKVNEDKIIGDAYDMAQKDKDVTDAMLLKVPPKERSALLTYIKKLNDGEMIKTDPIKFNQAMEQFENNPFEANKMNLSVLKPYISAEDMKTLQRKKESVSNAITGNKIKGGLADDRQVADIAVEFAKSKNIFDEQGMYQIRKISNEEFYRLQDENPNMSLGEVRQKIFKALYERGIKKTETKRFFGLSTSITEEINDSLAPEAAAPVINEGWANYLQDRAKRKGLPPLTDAQIKQQLKKLGEKYDTSIAPQGR